MKHSEEIKPARKNMVSFRALWIFGIILVMATASVGCSGRSFYSFSGDVFEGRGTRVDLEPGENFLKELGKAVVLEISKTIRGLDRFFIKVLEMDIESNLFRGGVFEGRGTRVDLEPGDNFLVEIGKAFVLEVSITIQGLDQGY